MDDEDDSVDANKAKEPRAYPRGIVAPIDRVRSHKLPAMNSVHVPLRNPVFAAFTACGTRLLLMNVRRHGEEFALHELDLTVAMASLHGATPGAAGARGLKFLAKNRRALAAGTSVVEEIPRRATTTTTTTTTTPPRTFGAWAPTGGSAPTPGRR